MLSCKKHLYNLYLNLRNNLFMSTEIFYKIKYKSPLGNITICCDECGKNIVGLWFEKQKYFASNIEGNLTENNKLQIFTKTINWLEKYFTGKKTKAEEIPIKLIGTKFQKSVWKILYKIPYGKVITYGDIAKQIEKQKRITKMSAQAVGCAVGHNPISIIIPCHRVIGKNRKLTGYAAGLDKKKKLLQIEKINI